MNTDPITTNCSEIQIDHRSNLYFDRYQYCVEFFEHSIHGLRSFRSKNFDQIEKHLLRLQNYWQKQVNIESLRKLYEFLAPNADQFRIHFTSNWARIYTNDLTWARSITSHCASVKWVNTKQAVIDRPHDVVSLVNPRHQWRAYLRGMYFELQNKSKLLKFLENNQDFLRSSPGLYEWLTWSGNKYVSLTYCNRWFFIDYNDPKYITALSLIVPGVIRTVKPIVRLAK